MQLPITGVALWYIVIDFWRSLQYQEHLIEQLQDKLQQCQSQKQEQNHEAHEISTEGHESTSVPCEPPPDVAIRNSLNDVDTIDDATTVREFAHMKINPQSILSIHQFMEAYSRQKLQSLFDLWT